MKISIVLPAYNEERNIEKAVLSSISVLKTIASEYEVIIVDDGSIDQTGAISDALSSKYNGVKVIHHRPNQGYGAALRTGFSNAQMDLVFYTDSDNQFDIKELKKLLPLTERSEIVTGYRIDRQDPPVRLKISETYNFLVRLLFKIKVKDVDCAFKLFKKEVFDEVEIEHEGFIVDIEILAKALRRGYRIDEMGVHHYPREQGESTVKFSSLLRTFIELIKLKIRLE